MSSELSILCCIVSILFNKICFFLFINLLYCIYKTFRNTIVFTRICKITQLFGSLCSWYVLPISCEYSFWRQLSQGSSSHLSWKGRFWLEKLLRKSTCLTIDYTF